MMWRLLLIVAVSLLPLAARAETLSIHRLALIAGSNDGGAARARLRYAESDARNMAQLLTDMGGVDRRGMTLLIEPSRAALESAMGRLQKDVARAAGNASRVEAIFYYSGHSDDQGLLLGDERYPYRDLKDALRASGADVRIAILDSCASGALVRLKGGSRRPAFLLDSSSEVSGHAILTSAAEDEAAQESDRVGGSFFTHYLATGLRGAADTSGDGKVTLNEAYQFAFYETLVRTEKSLAGPQHPAYDIGLAGSGDLVVTDLRSTSSGLILDEDIAGRVHVRDEEQRLIAELSKPGGRSMELALPAGDYEILVGGDGELRAGSVTLVDRQRGRVAARDLGPVAREYAVARGDFSAHDLASLTHDSTEAEPERVASLGTSLPGDGATRASGVGGRTKTPTAVAKPAMVAHPWLSRVDALRGMQLSFAGNRVSGEAQGMQLAFVHNRAGHLATGAQVSFGYNDADTIRAGAQMTLGFNSAEAVQGGLQSSLGANSVVGPMAGVQLGFGANLAGGGVSGVQLPALISVAHGLRGVQLSSTVGWVTGTASGAQVAAAVAVATEAVQGVQLAGGIAYAGALRGVQAAPLNIVGGGGSGLSMAGAQIGALNISGGGRGAQIGAVNVSTGDLRGVQLGVINFGENADAPIGLLNIMWRGRWEVELSGSDTRLMNLTLKTGGRYVHTIVSASIVPSRAGNFHAKGFGIGAHLPMGRHFYADLDLLAQQLTKRDFVDFRSPNAQVYSTRLIVGWEALSQLALFAGATYNVLATAERDPSGYSTLAMSPFGAAKAPGDLSWFGWLGFVGGVRFF